MQRLVQLGIVAGAWPGLALAQERDCAQIPGPHVQACFPQPGPQRVAVRCLTATRNVEINWCSGVTSTDRGCVNVPVGAPAEHPACANGKLRVCLGGGAAGETCWEHPFATAPEQRLSFAPRVTSSPPPQVFVSLFHGGDGAPGTASSSARGQYRSLWHDGELIVAPLKPLDAPWVAASRLPELRVDVQAEDGGSLDISEVFLEVERYEPLSAPLWLLDYGAMGQAGVERWSLKALGAGLEQPEYFQARCGDRLLNHSRTPDGQSASVYGACQSQIEIKYLLRDDERPSARWLRFPASDTGEVNDGPVPPPITLGDRGHLIRLDAEPLQKRGAEVQRLRFRVFTGEPALIAFRVLLAYGDGRARVASARTTLLSMGTRADKGLRSEHLQWGPSEPLASCNRQPFVGAAGWASWPRYSAFVACAGVGQRATPACRTPWQLQRKAGEALAELAGNDSTDARRARAHVLYCSERYLDAYTEYTRAGGAPAIDPGWAEHLAYYAPRVTRPPSNGAAEYVAARAAGADGALVPGVPVPLHAELRGNSGWALTPGLYELAAGTTATTSIRRTEFLALGSSSALEYDGTNPAQVTFENVTPCWAKVRFAQAGAEGSGAEYSRSSEISIPPERRVQLELSAPGFLSRLVDVPPLKPGQTLELPAQALSRDPAVPAPIQLLGTDADSLDLRRISPGCGPESVAWRVGEAAPSVEPGEYAVRAARAGYVPAEQSNVQLGYRSVLVDAKLESDAWRCPGASVYRWGLGAVGVSALTTGVFALLARNAQNDFDEQPSREAYDDNAAYARAAQVSLLVTGSLALLTGAACALNLERSSLEATPMR
ncbi:MAG TPA: hypothetical protein VNN80_10730 [Polyangiaceae bacterium]|nr:hypothetical protein [Polyangiaceae bacterium]